MASWVGFKQVAIQYDRKPRFSGATHYPFHKMFLFSVDAITSFSIVPLRILTMLGIILMVISLLISFVILVVRLTVTSFFIPGFALIYLMISFFGGLQMFALGVVGEYVGRIYEEVKRRPIYLISDVYPDNTVVERSSSSADEIEKI